MPDISMCNDKSCPSRKDCYRFMAKPSMIQSFALFDRKGKDRCESFIKLWNKKVAHDPS